MINSVVLIGKVTKIETNEDIAILSLEVKKPFKNTNGEYDSDLFFIEIWGGCYEILKEADGVGKNIGIQGRLKKTDDGTVKIIGEKITLIEGGNTNGFF